MGARMNRRMMFKTVAAACLSAMPVSRAVAAQDARSVQLTGVASSTDWPNHWTQGQVAFVATPQYREITNAIEWSAPDWMGDPIVLDFGDQHGAMTWEQYQEFALRQCDVLDAYIEAGRDRH